MTGVRVKTAVRAQNYYAVLGVPPGSTQLELHDAFIELTKLHHPDAGGLTEKFQCITQAYSVLKDAERRRNYDMRLYLAGGQCGRCEGKGLRRRLNMPVERCPACKGTGLK